MRSSELFFFASSGFIAGAIACGLGLVPLGGVIGLALIVPVLFILKIRSVVLLFIAVPFLVGTIYYAVDDYTYRLSLKAAEHLVHFEGKIIEEPRRSSEAQTAKIE